MSTPSIRGHGAGSRPLDGRAARARVATTRRPRIARLVRATLVPLALCAAAPLAAQERITLETLDARLARVERVLDQSLLDQLQRIDALQQELRQLRGEIERLDYDLDNQTTRGTDLYSDTDQRLTDLEEARDAGTLFGGVDAGLGGLVDPLGDPFDVADDGSGAGGGGGDGGDDGPAGGAVIVPEGGPIPATASFGDGPRPPTGRLRDTATQAEKASYTSAYDLLARGENEAAVAAFDAFLRSFPDGPYSDNAWYWQGEAMYAQRRFDEARRNFGAVVNSFPESTKVPDARLKIGFALFEEQAYAEARRILTEVQDDYPGRSAAVLARKRLQQMDREDL